MQESEYPWIYNGCNSLHLHAESFCFPRYLLFSCRAICYPFLVFYERCRASTPHTGIPAFASTNTSRSNDAGSERGRGYGLLVAGNPQIPAERPAFKRQYTCSFPRSCRKNLERNCQVSGGDRATLLQEHQGVHAWQNEVPQFPPHRQVL